MSRSRMQAVSEAATFGTISAVLLSLALLLSSAALFGTIAAIRWLYAVLVSA